MENGISIDTLHAQLLDLLRHDEYGFEALRCQDWGKANSDKYNKLKSTFIRSMRRLAKKAPVKYYNGAYYMFNLSSCSITVTEFEIFPCAQHLSMHS
jgi:hypothetical protein